MSELWDTRLSNLARRMTNSNDRKDVYAARNRLSRQAAELDALRAEVAMLEQDKHDLCLERGALTMERDRLRAFAGEVMGGFPHASLDEFELQATAVAHGVLIGRTVTEPCGEDCNCAEYYSRDEFAEGQTCYRLAEEISREALDG